MVQKRCLRVPLDRHPEPGFRWARAVLLRARLTRDDHTCKTMYQARALGALVQGNIKPNAHRRRLDCRPLVPAPDSTFDQVWGAKTRRLEQPPVLSQNGIETPEQRGQFRLTLFGLSAR